MSPIAAFMGQESTPPIWTLLRSTKVQPVTLTEAQLKSLLNVDERLKLCTELHLDVQDSLEKYWYQHRASASRRQFPNFVKGDYLLVSRSDFHANEKL